MSFAFRACAGVCLTLCSVIALAAGTEPPPQIWLNAGFLSSAGFSTAWDRDTLKIPYSDPRQIHFHAN